MAIRAVVFDIGGVLEITPKLGVVEKWEAAWGIPPGEMNVRLSDVWGAGSTGQITLAEVHRRIAEILNVSDEQVTAFMEEVWKEYLGTLNVELTEYFKSLRSRYKTAIISNSFVGAREREQEHYRFHEMADPIIYSHEVGIFKPNPRIFEMCWQQLGIQPNEMIYVDDAEMHVNAALALGIHGIRYTGNNAQTIAEIEACITQES